MLDGGDNNNNETASAQPGPRSEWKVLGVCGGIGSGKSTVCKLLVSELNCAAHLDADAIAHSVYRPGSPAVQEMVQTFGDDILTSNDRTIIDRKQLGSIVFRDRAAMVKLEGIVWPFTKDAIQQQIAALKRGDENNKVSTKRPIIIVEAAMLLDAGWHDMMDGVWVITADRTVTQQRLVQTRGLTQPEAEQRMAAQQSRRGVGNLADEVSKRTVTAVIENNSNNVDNHASLVQLLAEKLNDPNCWY